MAMRSMQRLVQTHASPAVIVIRFLAGGVFFIEGLKKFLFAAQWGAGRFAKIGIPFPGISGPFVGGIEVVCGLLLMLGLVTRLATGSSPSTAACWATANQSVSSKASAC